MMRLHGRRLIRVRDGDPGPHLYVVLCYAWERFENLDSAAAREHASVPDDLPQNLFARLLRDSFRRLWRRGLDRGYLERAEDARRPKDLLRRARTGWATGCARHVRRHLRPRVRRLGGVPECHRGDEVRERSVRPPACCSTPRTAIRSATRTTFPATRSRSVRLTWARAGRTFAGTFSDLPTNLPRRPAPRCAPPPEPLLRAPRRGGAAAWPRRTCRRLPAVRRRSPRSGAP